MKLCLITNGDPGNKKLWSGTPYTLKNLLFKRQEVELSYCNCHLNRIWRSLCARLFGRYEFVNGGGFDPWYHVLMQKKVESEMIKLDAQDFGLLVCCGNVPSKSLKGEKYAVYTDNIYGTYKSYLEGNVWWREKYERYAVARERECVKSATLVFTQNEWTRQVYVRDYGLPEEKVINVGFGVNLTPYNGEKCYEDENMLIVLRRGTEHYKGLELLLDAFEILHAKHPSVRLSVVGTTQREMDGVTYYEGFPREKTVELFQKSALYVMPALREPNGITYLEALANKSPIVGLNRFALPEFSGNGQWGFMSENEDPEELANVLEDALSDKERLRRMGLAGQQFVMQRYDWNIIVEKMINTMQKYLDKK